MYLFFTATTYFLYPFLLDNAADANTTMRRSITLGHKNNQRKHVLT